MQRSVCICNGVRDDPTGRIVGFEEVLLTVKMLLLLLYKGLVPFLLLYSLCCILVLKNSLKVPIFQVNNEESEASMYDFT